MLTHLLSTYSKRAAQHNSTAKNNYYKFNATAAYVKHSIALIQLQQYYATCTCFNTRYSINAAIAVANKRANYAFKHVNFCFSTATKAIAAYKLAQRNAAILAQRSA